MARFGGCVYSVSGAGSRSPPRPVGTALSGNGELVVVDLAPGAL